MDITAETIQKILDISKPDTHEIEDVNGINTIFSTKQLHQVKAAAPPVPEDVDVSTLAGFADLINAGLEDEDFPNNCMIHVEDERTVTCKTTISDKFGRRVVLIKAQPVDFAQFAFGRWMPQEEFVIAIASLFAETEDKNYVLHLAASLTNEATTNSEDNGFTQKATVKAGLALKSSVTLKPRVSLAPYRTFPEIAQPVSEFVFRARITGEGQPNLMLVEADGGRWKIDAMATIRTHMESFDLGIPIIA